ncbi:ROK family protein [Rhizobium sp. B21/90]|uniref:ROK family protein n=1 Tax=Rhizobium sp. B21/90 TaxID=2819993 RepID=UPI001C5AAD95|nr:ROK family protein [Rhizobium sp. B21/90]QYA03600.1 ROK family protein [Rhizobium sp. B21/90]
MTKTKSRSADKPQVVLSVDVGGSHVKVMTSAGTPERKIESGASLTATAMVSAVATLVSDWEFDVISIGFPGPVRRNFAIEEPVNLGDGWVGFDFAHSFGKPVKIVNDALMQAIGSYDGGRMLFLGLGTGLGSAMVIENVAQPMELAHLSHKKGKSFEDYLGEAGLKKRGKKKWRGHVFDVVDRMKAALLPDYVVIGGGNVDKLDELPKSCRRGDNTLAFEGGFRLWRDSTLIV